MNENKNSLQSMMFSLFNRKNKVRRKYLLEKSHLRRFACEGLAKHWAKKGDIARARAKQEKAANGSVYQQWDSSIYPFYAVSEYRKYEEEVDSAKGGDARFHTQLTRLPEVIYTVIAAMEEYNEFLCQDDDGDMYRALISAFHLQPILDAKLYEYSEDREQGGAPYADQLIDYAEREIAFRKAYENYHNRTGRY